jgi:hypothetical protein
MALCRTNVVSSGFSSPGQRRQRDRHSTKVCLDERLALVFLHRRADPVAAGWGVISISHSVPRTEGHPIFRGAVLHHSLRMKGHHRGVGGSGPPLNVSVRAKALALVKLGRYALQHADSLLRHALQKRSGTRNSP